MTPSLSPLARSVLAQIVDRFEEEEDGNFLLTCPIDRATSYDIYKEEEEHYTIVINDDATTRDSDLCYLPSVEAAQARIAEKIADKIVAAREIVENASTVGISFPVRS